jgi:hypothetical protein
VPVVSDDVLGEVEAALLRRLGAEPARAAVSFVGVERIEVLRWREGDVTYLCTLGASRHPMNDPQAVHVDTIGGPRVELLVRIRERASGSSDSLVRSLAVLAATPAVEGLVLRPDATIDLGEPLVPGSACTGFVLSGPEVSGGAVSPGEIVEQAIDRVGDPALDLATAAIMAPIDTGAVGVEPVQLLLAVPATSAELAWARVKGVDALRARFAATSTDLADLRRRTVSFDDPPA